MKKAFLAVLASLLIAGCVHEELKLTSSPDVLYQKAVKAVEESKFDDAKRYVEFIRTEYPFSPFAIEAELLEADSLFKQENYRAAIDAYGNFEDLHPFHEKAPYAMYRRGLSNFNLVDSSDRDMSTAKEAAKVFDQFVKSNPKSPLLKEAQEKLFETVNLLAEHEMYVAKYYMKKGEYRAALGRLRVLIDIYPDSASRDEALRLVDTVEKRLKKQGG